MFLIIVALQLLVVAIWVMVLGRVIVSWVDPRASKPVSQWLYRASEPLLSPIRNALPRTGQIDFSPLILLIGLGILMRVVLAL
jgi:YggT family protein